MPAVPSNAEHTQHGGVCCVWRGVLRLRLDAGKESNVGNREVCGMCLFTWTETPHLSSGTRTVNPAFTQAHPIQPNLTDNPNPFQPSPARPGPAQPSPPSPAELSPAHAKPSSAPAKPSQVRPTPQQSWRKPSRDCPTKTRSASPTPPLPAPDTPSTSSHAASLRRSTHRRT